MLNLFRRDCWSIGSLTKSLRQLRLGWAEARSQQLKSDLPMWVARTQVLEPSPAVSQGVHKQEVEMENRVGTQTQTLPYRIQIPQTASQPLHPVPAPGLAVIERGQLFREPQNQRQISRLLVDKDKKRVNG